MNAGNFFSTALGRGYDNSVALSVPFEFVGNYGYVAGVLSFALLGVCWAAFHATITSVSRLATHPLMPLCALWMTNVEMPLGNYLAIFRDLIFVLACCYLVWVVLRRKL